VNVFKLVDIRTEASKGGKLISKKQKPYLLKWVKLITYAWKNIDGYQILFEDEFYGPLGKTSNPFKNNPAKLSPQGT